MPLYFAYGSNMDRAGMARRCPASRPVGLARLERHGFFIMTEGYASLRPDRRGTVHGLLWDLALADVGPLDRYEEVSRGLYRKHIRPVLGPAGPRNAMVYIGASTDEGRPQTGYMEAVVDAAGACGLPDPYIAELSRWRPGAPPPHPRSARRPARTPT